MEVTKPYIFIRFGAMEVTCKLLELEINDRNVKIVSKQNLAELKAKIKIQKLNCPQDSSRNRAQTSDSPRAMAVRTFPRDPPGEGGGQEQN